MSERWVTIKEFPQYEVSTSGRVRHVGTQAIRKFGVNNRGIVFVSFRVDGRLHVRSVAKLVVETFTSKRKYNESFNSHIHLDRDKTNCNLYNLMPRPRWFVYKYYEQFNEPNFRSRVNLYKEDTNEVFDNYPDICIQYGLHYHDIIESAHYGRTVFPTDSVVVFRPLPPLRH